MVRVKYSNGDEVEYGSLDLARFKASAILVHTSGRIVPLEAVEILGKTSNGYTVEKKLFIKLGVNFL